MGPWKPVKVQTVAFCFWPPKTLAYFTMWNSCSTDSENPAFLTLSIAETNSRFFCQDLKVLSGSNYWSESTGKEELSGFPLIGAQKGGIWPRSKSEGVGVWLKVRPSHQVSRKGRGGMWGAGTQVPLEGFTLPPSDRKPWDLSSCEVQIGALEGSLASMKNLCDFTQLLYGEELALGDTVLASSFYIFLWVVFIPRH